MPREPDLLPDWFIGGAGKRRLLNALAHEAAWGDNRPPWSKKRIARLAGLNDKNAVARHVEVLELAELIEREHGTYHLNTAAPLLKPIRDFTDALAVVPLRRLPRSRGR